PPPLPPSPAPPPPPPPPPSLHDALPISTPPRSRAPCCRKSSTSSSSSTPCAPCADAQPPLPAGAAIRQPPPNRARAGPLRRVYRSEEHTSELQSRENLVCRLLLEKKTRA